MSQRIKKKPLEHHEPIKQKNNGNDLWKIASITLGILLVLSIFTQGFSKIDLKGLFAGKSKLVIEEYSDFQCPFCARALPTIQQIKKDYGDKVEVVYKHFPLSFHQNAQKAAEASECARDQGKFWEMHDVLFQNQGALDVNSLKKYAVDLKLNSEKFNTCLDSGAKTAKVQADFAEGQKKGVQGTPTFFINGEQVVGAQPFTAFKTVIDKQLSSPSKPAQDTQPTAQPEEEQQAPAAPEVPKTDKPVVEAFVMSHCPYGTQIEKGLLPVAKVLGDNIDFKVKFVYYAMHGEKEVYEQLLQYCIQEEQNDKYMDYLYCFLEAGDTAACLDKAAIDKTKLETCKAAADTEFEVTKTFKDQTSWISGRFPPVNFYKTENDKYGVRGSPTLVINGQQVSAARDSKSLLALLCNAFNTQPEACKTEFTSDTPAPGFGWEAKAQANAAAAGCGG